MCAYAVMSNHLHVVVRIDADRAERWSDEEVVRRYTSLYRMAKTSFEDLTEREKKVRRRTWRARLADLSWFMRALNENIARRANHEEGIRGRFWEGRFRSQPLLDEHGLLMCMAYVDLNPVRAGIADSLEESSFTSIEERLTDLAKKRAQRRRQTAPDTLAAFEGQGSDEDEELPLDLAGYVELLEWAGSAIREGKGRLREPPPRLLDAVDADAWLEALHLQKLATAAWIGSARELDRVAKRRGQRWCRGVRLARTLAK
ncbi:MAG: transposase [Myxococcota bacterium]